jgi:ABC-type multidrug transport system ATPase subunit
VTIMSLMSAVTAAPAVDAARSSASQGPLKRLRAIEADSIVQHFGDKRVLDSVSLAVEPGSIHALLGPNGAGKTTLLRILSGLLVPTVGTVRILGRAADNSREFRSLIGLVPSGDRTFYLRITGLENLMFFARLQGATKREAKHRAGEVLDEVGLADAARTRVGFYSHGMQKRLSVARALLTNPPILLVDEATHDLDPEGAERVRDLVVAAARRGAAVIWATQRLDEIRGLAHGVTLIAQGRQAFAGSVPELVAHAIPRRYLLRLRGSMEAGALNGLAALEPTGHGAEHFLLVLQDDAVLGETLAALEAAGVGVLTCTEERSGIEQAFLSLAGAR